MEKIAILSGVFVMLASAAANAEISVGIGIGVPAYPAPVVEPAPVYVEPGPGYAIASDWPSNHYDIHRHRHNDYWAHRQHEGRGYEERHAERR